MRPTVIVVLVGWLSFPAAALAGWPKAARQVKLGIEQFAAGDYAAAGKAFAEAETAAPHDMRIAFDRACAYAAEGKQAEALEWFRKAALAEDPKLASRCRYNLGCLSVERARAALGEKSEEAKPDARAEALAALETAIGHFRGSLELEPEDIDARHNAEAARLWIAHINEVWRKRDAQAQRDKMDLLGYLKMLDGRQRSLRLTGKGLAKAPRSARQRQQVYQSAKQQSYLVEEIEPLKAKIQAAVQQPPATRPGTQPAGQPGAQPQPQTAPQADPKKAVQVLGGLADNAGKAMQAAAEELHNNAPAAAVGLQAEAVEKLDEVYTVLAPYVTLVQSAVKKQQALVAQSAQACGKGKKEEPKPENQAAEAAHPRDPAPRVDRPPVDLAESPWNQQFITGYSEIIRAKAQQGLKNMPPPPPKTQQPAEEDPDASAVPPATRPPVAGPPLPPGVNPSPQGDHPTDQADPAEQLKHRQEAALKQQEAMRKAMQNAVKYAPKVRTLTLEATDQLEDGRPGLALPKQEEALELLKKMLPEQPQNQNQQQQQQQQEQNKDKKDKQDNKGKDKQDKDKQDKGNQDKDKQDDKKQDQGKQDQKKQDHKNQDQKDQQSQQQQARQPRDLSKQQADAVLRKARQRQQEKRKLEKALQLHLYRPGKVEKDW